MPHSTETVPRCQLNRPRHPMRPLWAFNSSSYHDITSAICCMTASISLLGKLSYPVMVETGIMPSQSQKQDSVFEVVPGVQIQQMAGRQRNQIDSRRDSWIASKDQLKRVLSIKILQIRCPGAIHVFRTVWIKQSDIILNFLNQIYS